MSELLRRLHAPAAPERVRGCDSVRPSRDVLTARIDDRCVLLDLREEKYLGLDAIGSRIWSAVESGSGNEQLIDELTRDYDVPRAVLEQDTDTFLRDLYRRGLVVLT